MLLKTKPWWVGCTMLQVWFHPMCWRLSYTKPAPAGQPGHCQQLAAMVCLGCVGSLAWLLRQINAALDRL